MPLVGHANHAFYRYEQSVFFDSFFILQDDNKLVMVDLSDYFSSRSQQISKTRCSFVNSNVDRSVIFKKQQPPAVANTEASRINTGENGLSYGCTC